MNTISNEMAVSQRLPMADRILREVGHAPGCELDALVLNLGCHWQEVALEVHRLSRTGQLQLSACGGGIYTVSATAVAGERDSLTLYEDKAIRSAN